MALYNPEAPTQPDQEPTILTTISGFDAHVLRNIIDNGGIRVLIGDDMHQLALLMDVQQALNDAELMDDVKILISEQPDHGCLVADFVFGG